MKVPRIYTQTVTIHGIHRGETEERENKFNANTSKLG